MGIVIPVEKRVTRLQRASDKMVSAWPDKQEEALQKAIDAGVEETASEIARNIRNRLLAECDYRVLADYPSAGTDGEDWATYRQQLRDLPEQAGFPAKTQWPARPGKEAASEPA